MYHWILNAICHPQSMTNQAWEMNRKSTEKLPSKIVWLFRELCIKILDSFSIKSKYTFYSIYSIIFLN